MMSDSNAARIAAVAAFLLLACNPLQILRAEVSYTLPKLAEERAETADDINGEAIVLTGYCSAGKCGCGSQCDCGSSCDCGCCSCCSSPGWYAVADVIAYGRDNDSRRRPLLENTGFAPLIFTDDLDYDFAPGVRLRLGKHNGPCSHCDACEIEYLGIFNWYGSEQVNSVNNIFLPGALGFSVNGFQGADEVSIDYTSDLHSLELNCVQCCCECCCTRIETLCGIRYVRFGEDLTLATNNVPPPPTVNALYHVDVDNNLYGAQLGARMRTMRASGFGFECTCKGGIYGNDANQEQYIIDNIGAAPFNFRPRTGASEGSVAFVGELSFVPMVRLDDVWSLRCGYNILWIEGVALAPDQLDFTDTPTSGTSIDTSGGVFAHGVSAGLEARF